MLQRDSNNSLRQAQRARIRSASSAAFTVIELMLAVGILGFIIYALFSVFNETQRALRRSETSTDVAQKARAVSDIIRTELEQAQPTYSFWRSNSVLLKETNMLGGLERTYIPIQMDGQPERTDIFRRTNYIHNLFFYNNRTNAWQGIGYRVVYFTNGVGSLQRFETNLFGHKPISNINSGLFLTTDLTNRVYRHVADGVVHLTFVPYDENGRRLGWDTKNYLVAGYSTNDYLVTRARFGGGALPGTSDTVNPLLRNVGLQEAIPTDTTMPNIHYTTAFSFMSNALPAYIEMELGMLEPETLEQYYTMVEDQNPNSQNFLQRQIGKVHLFRQRIHLRTAAQ